MRFEDGTIREHVRSQTFKAGNIAPVTYEERQEARLGQEKVFSDGHTGRITRYRSSADIDVAFDTGKVVRGTKYENCIRGRLSAV